MQQPLEVSQRHARFGEAVTMLFSQQPGCARILGAGDLELHSAGCDVEQVGGGSDLANENAGDAGGLEAQAGDMRLSRIPESGDGYPAGWLL